MLRPLQVESIHNWSLKRNDTPSSLVRPEIAAVFGECSFVIRSRILYGFRRSRCFACWWLPCVLAFPSCSLDVKHVLALTAPTPRLVSEQSIGTSWSLPSEQPHKRKALRLHCSHGILPLDLVDLVHSRAAVLYKLEQLAVFLQIKVPG